MILTFQFLFSGVHFVFFRFLYWPESSQHLHKLTEVHSVAPRVSKECVDNPVSQWINSQLRYAEEVFPAQSPTVTSIQTSKSRVQPLNLIWRNCNINKLLLSVIIKHKLSYV